MGSFKFYEVDDILDLQACRHHFSDNSNLIEPDFNGGITIPGGEVFCKEPYIGNECI